MCRYAAEIVGNPPECPRLSTITKYTTAGRELERAKETAVPALTSQPRPYFVLPVQILILASTTVRRLLHEESDGFYLNTLRGVPRRPEVVWPSYSTSNIQVQNSLEFQMTHENHGSSKASIYLSTRIPSSFAQILHGDTVFREDRLSSRLVHRTRCQIPQVQSCAERI